MTGEQFILTETATVPSSTKPIITMSETSSIIMEPATQRSVSLNEQLSQP